jgi:hypothetical protein
VWSPAPDDAEQAATVDDQDLAAPWIGQQGVTPIVGMVDFNRVADSVRFSIKTGLWRRAGRRRRTVLLAHQGARTAPAGAVAPLAAPGLT